MRLRNNIFAAAFDYMKREKGIKTQKQLAQLMGVSEDTITRILKDRCEVTEDIITKLQTASGCIFNLQWLRGEDAEPMLASDLIESQQQPVQGMPDQSSLVNALIAAKDDAIIALKRELSAKDETIKTKDDQIAILQNLLKEKDDHISTLKSRTAELRRIIDSNQYYLEHLPFPPGVADKPNDKTHINK